MRSRPPLAAVLLLVVTAALAVGDHSASPCTYGLTTVATPAATLYLVEDTDDAIWIYQESNGHAGLQRGGVPWWSVGQGWNGDDCWDVDVRTMAPVDDPDRILF